MSCSFAKIEPWHLDTILLSHLVFILVKYIDI